MTIEVAIVVAIIAFPLITLFLPEANEGALTFLHAGMLAIYLVVLAYGAIEVAKGAETAGWFLIFVGAGCFVFRMWQVLNGRKR
jgi:hypothetical protein